jgi:GNAT superfamily N-acetyltransferase
MTIQVRKVESKDTEALADILRSIEWFAHLHSEPVEATRARIARHLNMSSADASHSIYVAENASGKVIGYIGAHWLPSLFLPGPEGYVAELFVLNAERGQGVGTKLLEAVKTEGIERGCVRLMLINNRNRESYQRDFYKKLGWQERQNMVNFMYWLAGD